MRIVSWLLIGTSLGGSAVALGVWFGLHERPMPPAPTVVVAAAPEGSTPGPAPNSSTEPVAAVVVAAAQGRVEGRTESVEVGAAADGVIEALFVKEGQRVAQNEIIATIGCANLASEIRSIEAARDGAGQTRIRLLRGSRDEERQIAEQHVLSTQAILEQARLQNERMQFLLSKDDVSRQAAEAAKRDLDTAEASHRSALQSKQLVNAGPLPEEVAKADAEVLTIEEKLRTAQSQQEKCNVRSPINGTVIHVNLMAGESFSTLVPRPIITMADLSRRRIRAEVDERDLTRIKVGQAVRISAEGLPNRFGGKVTWTAVVMGRKTARSTDPAERADRDVLEALIEPDKDASRLPIGLRVAVEFLRD